MKRLVEHLAPLLGSGALTFLLYGYSLSLSFMLDDFDDLPRAAVSSVATILTSSRGYVYYRPLAHLIEKLPYLLQGYYDPFWYHLLPLFLHALNGWLVYLLARRLAGAWAAPWAAALFLLYPLSYQVVPWVGAVMHPLMVVFALGALLAYYEGRRRPSLRWVFLSLALALALLALPAHENGVLVGIMIVALEVFLWRQGFVTRPSALPLAFLAPAAAFLALWWFIPKQSQPWTLEPNSLQLNALFFLQGLVYPVAGTLGGLGRWLALPGEGLSWGALPISLATLALVYFWRKGGSFLLLSLSWFAIAVFPAWAFLSYAYVIDGPRLLYLASVPAALLWAGLWQLPRGQGRGAFLWRLGLLGLTGAILWQSWSFLSVRREMFRDGSSLVWQVANAAAQDPGARTLVVNVPAWFAAKEPEYPVGHMGVTFLPDYLGLDRAVFMHRGVTPKVESLNYEDLLSPWRYDYGPHGRTVALEELAAAVREADRVYLTAYEVQGVSLVLAGQLGRLSATAQADGPSQGVGFLADFAGRLRLVEAQVRREGEALLVDLAWLSRAPVTEDLTVFLHLYDGQGRLVAQADGYPLRGLFPFRFWRPEILVREVRRLALPPGLDAGDYTVSVGVYDRASGARQTARDQAGVAYPDHAVPVGRVRLPAAAP